MAAARAADGDAALARYDEALAGVARSGVRGVRRRVVGPARGVAVGGAAAGGGRGAHRCAARPRPPRRGGAGPRAADGGQPVSGALHGAVDGRPAPQRPGGRGPPDVPCVPGRVGGETPGSSRARSWCSSIATSPPVRPPSAPPTSGGCAATSWVTCWVEGAFGTVYRAIQPGLGRDVALKVIGADMADDAAFVRRFEAEAQLVARLEHPHIVPLYDFWREPGGAYLAFRLLRGGTPPTRSCVTGRGCSTGSIGFVEEIGSALVAAHGAGVVHRDVKPSNVLFDESGNAYLTDFGIAQLDAAAPRCRARRRRLAALRQPGAGARPSIDAALRPVQLRRHGLGAAHRRGPVPEWTSRVLASSATTCPASARQRTDLPDGVDVVLRTAGAARPDDRFATMADLLLAWRQAVGRARRCPQRRPSVDVGPTPRVAAARTLDADRAGVDQPVQGTPGVPRSRPDRLLRTFGARRSARRPGRRQPVRHRGRPVGFREELARPCRAGPAAARRRPHAGRVDGPGASSPRRAEHRAVAGGDARRTDRARATGHRSRDRSRRAGHRSRRR